MTLNNSNLLFNIPLQHTVMNTDKDTAAATAITDLNKMAEDTVVPSGVIFYPINPIKSIKKKMPATNGCSIRHEYYPESGKVMPSSKKDAT